MKYLKQFIIPISGLDAGTRQFEFDIDGAFFEQYPQQDIRDCSIGLKLDIHKQEDLLILQFSFSGGLGLICDRCLDPFHLEIRGEELMTLKFTVRGISEQGEEECILPDAKEIDIRQYIYDFIMLRIPFRRAHPEDESGISQCDEAVLKKIEELNQQKEEDPRWDRLKNMRNN